jgi:hypothetical protein
VQLFVDMDGVLADFDAHHEAVFGVRSSTLTDIVDWSRVRETGDFYLSIPPMPGMIELWTFVEPHHPIVLTGVPYSVPEAPEQKRAWVHRHLGADVEVRCCRSAEKCRHAQLGDILIDDWEKYQSLWLAKGGLWITHVSAAQTIDRLRAIL